MRILFFIDSLKAGGKERRLTELMKDLRQRPDIDFRLVVMSNELHYKEVLDLKIGIYYLIRKNKKDLSIFKKFYNLCSEYKPDIVHCWNSMTAIYAMPICQLMSIKLVNGLIVDTPIQKNILNENYLRAKITFPFSKIIIGNSNAGLEAYKAPKKKSACVYNGMDLKRFNTLRNREIVKKELFGDQITDDLFIIGMVGAFEDRKDYKTVIKSAISITSKIDRVRFVLVGDGKNLNAMKKSVPANLLSKIIFLGRRNDVESIINTFDIGILLTNTKVHGEGISNSIIEYMALRKPVIATRGGGTNEVVIDGVNGYLIDPENDIELSEKIEKLMLNKNLLIELGIKAKQLVLEKFDVKIMAENYVNIYSSLVF